MVRVDVKKLPGARKSRLPSFIPPQLATLVKEPPSGDEWLHELKFDGYRDLSHRSWSRQCLEPKWKRLDGEISESYRNRTSAPGISTS